ncbi:MAG: hypothetical protein LC729_00625 [Acidobacteria bacterium]|nr:hypothetical protein [Acidobacteriota bacterium]
MGLFDQMFGSGASAAQSQPNVQKRFNELKTKYQSVLDAIEQQQVQLQNLHVQDDRLLIKGTVSSQDAMDRIWDQIKLMDKDNETDLTCDISVDTARLAGGSW